MQINSLGYVGLEAEDPEAWLRFAVEVIGAMPARAVPGEGFTVPGMPETAPRSGGRGIAPDGSAFVKIDDRQWRIAVHPGSSGTLRYFGLEVADAGALASAVRELRAGGVDVTAATAPELTERGVAGMAWMRDPDGNRVELFHGAVHDLNFQSAAAAEFVTGSLGMGHVLLLTPDLERAASFYTSVLGFRRSDYMRFGPGMGAEFLRCNPRHHTVGVMQIGDAAGLFHLLVEMTELDHVGRALERAEAAGVTITSSLGRHKNDRMVSFYMRSPSGVDVEVGWDGLLVDEQTWSDRALVEGDTWGHHGLTIDAIQTR